jgi:two-component system, LytTR family, response regulator
VRALIVDDEAPARAKIRRLLLAAGGIEIAAEASTGREAVAAIKRGRPDIVFLDVEMPGLDGFGVVDALERDGGPYVVFVTAHDHHAIRAFEVGAVDYLLKPFTPERFDRMLERARDRLAGGVADAKPLAVAGSAYLRRILVVNDGRALFLPVERIDRVEAERNYVVLVSGTVRHRMRATIGSLAARLDPAHFLRLNRSTLVRLDAVREMHEWSHGDFRVVMQDGAELIWSRRYRAAAGQGFGVGA